MIFNEWFVNIYVIILYLDNIFHRKVSFMSHESDDTEDDKASKDTGGTVGESNEDGISVAIVTELVVTRQGDQSSKWGS